MKEKEIVNFYKNFWDRIEEKRLNPKFPLRRYVHLQNYLSILKYVRKGEKVLEVGCGEGILSVMIAKKGNQVIGCDISRPNLGVAKERAKRENLKNIEFLECDACNLPFPDNSFDLVIADNVLEHLPDFWKGLSEIRRVTKSKAIIALPTCLNLCAFCLLGGDVFWKITRKTPFAILVGFLRVLKNIFKEGVDEGYGPEKLPHLWRYPWVMKRQLKRAGFEIVSFEAASICLPYFNFNLPLVKFLDRFKRNKFLANFGYGSIAYLKKKID